MRRRGELFEVLHLPLDPRARVGSLAVAQQQMVEIAKALSFNADVLIMDEPTAPLTDTEIDELFRIIRDLRARGVGVVYISHGLDELKQISDRVTVMRDGRFIDTVATAEAPIDQIISMMVGRTIFEAAPEIPEKRDDEVVLEVRGLNRGRVVRDVSFQLRRGEILGFAGLVGAGRTEVARLIFGADRADSGEILIHGKAVTIAQPVATPSATASPTCPRTASATGLRSAWTSRPTSSWPRCGGTSARSVIVNSRETRATAEREVQHLAIKTPVGAPEGPQPVGRQPAEDRRRASGSRATPTS